MRKHLTSIPFSNHFIAYQESIPDLDLYVTPRRLSQRSPSLLPLWQRQAL